MVTFEGTHPFHPTPKGCLRLCRAKATLRLVDSRRRTRRAGGLSVRLVPNPSWSGLSVNFGPPRSFHSNSKLPFVTNNSICTLPDGTDSEPHLTAFVAVRRIAVDQFGGEVSYDWDLEGLIVRLNMPSERLLSVSDDAVLNTDSV
jgi:hypothetical protein